MIPANIRTLAPLTLTASMQELGTMQNRSSSRAGLMIIGVFKLIKALALVVVGIGVLKLVHHDIVDVLSGWVSAVHVDPDNKYFQQIQIGRAHV